MVLEAIVLAHLASTWFMVGLIWLIQLVHYPLSVHVDASQYVVYQKAHMQRIGVVVAIPMAVEGLTTLALLVERPPGVPLALTLVGAAFFAVAYLTTALVSAPTHGRLVEGFDAKIHERLVSTNWIRTVAWTLRGVICVLVAALAF